LAQTGRDVKSDFYLAVGQFDCNRRGERRSVPRCSQISINRAMAGFFAACLWSNPATAFVSVLSP
jgi:hypothetical protein